MINVATKSRFLYSDASIIDKQVLTVAWNRDGTLFATGIQGVRIWSIGNYTGPIKLRSDLDGNVAWNPKQNILAIYNDLGVYLWNTDTDIVTQVASGAVAVAWSPDGYRMLIAQRGSSQVSNVDVSSVVGTPSATPTSTATPTKTFTPTPTPVSLRLQYYPDPDSRGNLVESGEPDNTAL